MGVRVLRAVLIGLLVAVAAEASGPQDFAGTWVMKIAGRNLFVLKLDVQGGSLNGTFSRPEHLSSANGLIFANVRGLRVDPVVDAHLTGDVLHFTTQNASDPKDRDEYVMTLRQGHAELMDAALPPTAIVAPRIFERSSSDAKVATDWEPNRAYTANDSDASNAEMSSIYDEDQRVRMTDNIDWKVVSSDDAKRRDRTRALLTSGALHTGEDFEHAAFVFQHGDSPTDYLLAHTLAMVAVTKGQPTAIWIAAATLDRYLQKVGQKQIFGTQFLSDPKNAWTQEPYDHALVSDSLRGQVGVPPVKLQEEQLKAYQNQK